MLFGDVDGNTSFSLQIEFTIFFAIKRNKNLKEKRERYSSALLRVFLSLFILSDFILPWMHVFFSCDGKTENKVKIVDIVKSCWEDRTEKGERK